jgi:hypothetical protein
MFKTDRVLAITNLDVSANTDIGYQVGNVFSEGTIGGAVGVPRI